MIWPLEVLLFVFLLATAIIALEANELLVAVVTLSVFSFLMALLFTTMGAVDVGFAEAVVGAGITGILFVVAIYQTQNETRY
jgi:multicomponent Na+:H+ antiporter subunit B